MPNIVLILGSAPDAVRCREWARTAFSAIVTINNAWAIRPDWDFLIHADDFPADRLPQGEQRSTASIVKSDAFVPAQNAFGGFVYGGGTMAFTAGYWALHALQPDLIVFLGCDMVYPKHAQTHFYGDGTADPLRDDITLRSLEAKSARMFITALRRGTICLNLSDLHESRLAIPRVTLPFIERLTATRISALRSMLDAAVDATSRERADELENRLGYLVEDGRYWRHLSGFDSDALGQVDRFWTLSAGQLPRSVVPSQGCWRRREAA